MKIKMHPSDKEFVGYVFECPGCDGSLHLVYTEKTNRLNARWTFNGDVDKPTFSPSILIQWTSDMGKNHVCHSFIRDGNIEFCSDSTHALSGQTVPLPDLEGEA